MEMTISLYILGSGGRSVALRARLGSLRPPAGASCRPFDIHDRQCRRALCSGCPYAHRGALLPGSRWMFGTGAGARHDPRHVSGARSGAAPRAHQSAGDGGAGRRPAHRRRTQRAVGLADDPGRAQRFGRGQFHDGVASPAGDASRSFVCQRVAICAGLCRAAALPAVLGLLNRRRLRDDVLVRVHRLRAFHFYRSAACSERERGAVSRPPRLRHLARQPARQPIDRPFLSQSVCGRRQRGQRGGGRVVPRSLDHRPGDACRNYCDDVRVQRRRGRGGARGPRQGDQREPTRYRNSVRTLRFGSDGCRGRCWSCSPAGGRTRR